jgi:hypothetical protein
MVDSVRDAFAIISDAWRDGRPIVPLFGAGFSAGAGIPLTGGMVDYLAKVHWHFSQGDKTDLLEPRETAAKLLTTGWPEPHELNAHILQQWRGNARALAKWTARDQERGMEPLSVVSKPLGVLPAIVERVLRELGLSNDPNRWLVLLQKLCDGKQDLKDLFFARLEQGRRPATSHQLAAFLAGLMGWQLVLTTNFDTLLEQALRSQSLDPAIYELPEQGQAPDPQLVRSHFSIVKLHGGAFGRLMSETLNYSLPTEDRNRLLGYFPKNPLVVVLGYGGGDQRVMSLIKDLVHTDGEPYTGHGCTAPRVLWVHRCDRPRVVERIQDGLHERAGLLVTYQYRNGGRFLQELYCRLASSHPVSSAYYRAFPHMGPSTANALSSADPPPDAPVVVFHCARAGSGTSTALARAVENLSHEVIWCDLEAIATVDGLVTYLQNRFRRFDAGLPSFAFFQTDGHRLSALPGSEDPRVHYILQAMGRGRYAVAIDSLGEFGASFHSYTGALPPNSQEARLVTQERKRLQDFLMALIKRHQQFGESRLLFAHTYLELGKESVDAEARKSGKAFVHRLQEMGEESPESIHVIRVRSATGARGGASRDQIRAAAIKRWKKWRKKDPRKYVAIALAACFRRRRDLVVLRRLLFKVVCHPARPGRAKLDEVFAKLGGFSMSGWESGIGHPDRDEIDAFLAGLEPLLVQQEGGFYWMHSISRNGIYRKVCELVGPAIAHAHDLIAAYYYNDLFRPSNDPAALFEYVFQRLMSIHWSEDRRERLHRLHDLTGVLHRERDHILRDTHAGSLLRCISRCREVALEDEPEGEGEQAEVQDELRRVLCELEAEACRQACLFERCKDIRHRQIEHRLRTLLKDHGAHDLAKEVTQLANELVNGQPQKVFHSLVQRLLPKLSAPFPVRRQEQFASVDLGVLFRLLDHVVEVAACMASLGNEDAAKQLLGLVRAVCKLALNKEAPEAARYLLQLFRAIGDVAADKLVRLICAALANCPREVRRQVQDVRVRCAFRLMEVNLRSISPWAKDSRPARESSLHAAIDEYTEGQHVLQEYTGWQDRHYDKYVCFLNTLRARAAYLPHTRDRWDKERPGKAGGRPKRATTCKGEFALAYLFLDAARSQIRRPMKGSDFSALAIILLHRAECLMLHADDELDKASAGDAEKASAKSKLDRARTALHQAHTFLERGRPQVWAWTWLRVLEAQLEHEVIVWHLGGGAADEQAPRECAAALRKGLRSVRIGLDSCRPSAQREKEMKILWWQFYACVVLKDLTTAPTKEKALEERGTLLNTWKQLNAEAGLETLYRANESMAEHHLVPGNIAADLPLTRKALLAVEDRLLRVQGMPLFREGDARRKGPKRPAPSRAGSGSA